MAGQDHCRLSVSDVYETAAAIGCEFQQTIDLYGAATVDKLLPQVQRALEQLEMLAKASENSSLEIGEMRLEIYSLRSELEKEKEKTGRGVEEMREIVEGLERENKALRSRVRLEEAGALPGNNGGGKEHSPLCGDDGEAAREVEESLQKLSLRLMGTNDELKFRDKEIASRNQDILALESQIKRLTTVNQNLRKEIALVKARYQTLSDAKTAVDLQLEVARQAATKAEEQLKCREEQLEEKVEANEDMIENDDKNTVASEKEVSEDNAASRPRYTLEELRSVLTDRNDWKMKAEELKGQVHWLKARLSPDIDWPEDEDGLEIRKSLRVTPPKKQRSSTVPLQKSVDMAVESMEMRRLSGNGMDETDGKESGVKMIFQTVGEAGVKSDTKKT